MCQIKAREAAPAPALIPLSVIVVTKNEEARLARCLSALFRFDDVWVVDSDSDDKTRAIAQQYGVRIADFTWNGAYPKKRQWCLETLDLKYDRVFFVDADEVVTPDIAAEIAALDFKLAGYFIRSRYIWNGKMLRHGLLNSKLVLFDRRKVEFPVVDDLDIPGMGEIEGHYQPVLKPQFAHETLGVLQHFMLHDAGDDRGQWAARHARYAQWEAAMIARDAYPRDPVWARQVLKTIFRRLPFRWVVAFVHCYVLKLGFLDGAAGFDFAESRARYYRMVARSLKAL
ncbi:MAG: glycosyltransferase family 2 protein [Bdellovibrionales bacterium]